ncbi:DUF7660 family protein [Streptomyces sp. HF10]|uniref:DUF7660 family protein n=1 Tax=Streptomyces sp. HF10 TaxID=2692233 RepID=UPI0013198125|nr:hypothetical protein [Streptomyces sp. HF10]QHC32599.1 hypothetical protein GR129_31325 [Streptomyces sp. HF10]
MNYEEEAGRVRDRQSLTDFLSAASRDFVENPEGWENRDIATFLESMAAWISDCDGFFRRKGELPPSDEVWVALAKVIAAARIYE